MIVENVLDALASPNDFFDDGVESLPFWQPALVVSLAGVLSAVQAVLVTRFAFSGVQGVGETAMGIAMIVTVVVGFLTVFVMWLLYAGFIHGVSSVLGADRGSFIETFQVTGWGFLPTLISSGISVYATWDLLQRLPPSAATNQTFQTQFQTSTMFQVVAVIGIVTALWQGAIWAYGTHDVRGVDLRRAVLTAFIPVAVSVGLTVLGTF